MSAKCREDTLQSSVVCCGDLVKHINIVCARTFSSDFNLFDFGEN